MSLQLEVQRRHGVHRHNRAEIALHVEVEEAVHRHEGHPPETTDQQQLRGDHAILA